MHAGIIGHMYMENVESVKLETATANRDGLASRASNVLSRLPAI